MRLNAGSTTRRCFQIPLSAQAQSAFAHTGKATTQAGVLHSESVTRVFNRQGQLLRRLYMNPDLFCLSMTRDVGQTFLNDTKRCRFGLALEPSRLNTLMGPIDLNRRLLPEAFQIPGECGQKSQVIKKRGT